MREPGQRALGRRQRNALEGLAAGPIPRAHLDTSVADSLERLGLAERDGFRLQLTTLGALAHDAIRRRGPGVRVDVLQLPRAAEAEAVPPAVRLRPRLRIADHLERPRQVRGVRGTWPPRPRAGA